MSCRVSCVVEQKVVSYLIASHHKFGMARNLSSASPDGVRSISAEGLAKYQTTPTRWRYATFRPHATHTTHDIRHTHTRHTRHIYGTHNRTLGRNLPSAKGLTLPALSTAGSLTSTNTATGMGGPPGDEALRSIRVHVLQMLLGTATTATTLCDVDHCDHSRPRMPIIYLQTS